MARKKAKEREEDEEELGVPSPPPARVVKFVVHRLGRHPWLLTSSLVLSVFIGAADILSISLVLPFVKNLGGAAAAGAEDVPLAFLDPLFADLSVVAQIRLIAMLLLAVQVVRGLLSYVQGRLSGFLVLLVERDLRQEVFDEVLRVDLRWIHAERSSNLLAVMHNYPRESARLVGQYLGGVSRAVTAVSLVVALLYISWQLTLIALGLGIASLLVVMQMRRALKRMGRSIREERVNLQQTSLESIQGMKTVRLFAREDYARDRFLDHVRRLQRQSFRNASLSSAAAPLQRTLNTALFSVLLIAATFVLDRSNTGWIFLLTVFLLMMARLSAPLANFAKRSARIASETPAVEAVVDFLEREKPYVKDGTVDFERLRSRVSFEGVTFAYAAGGPPAVSDLTFDLPAGRTLALVGESGSGKSTVVHLLSRLYDPTAGRVLVDGRDVREFRGQTWRRRVAVVSQDATLFNTSVRENIRFGRLDATDAEVEEAARQANAHEFILGLERGYDTIVGERAVRLSGGQAQRITIARAILADPDVLVLDEATSALDVGTERAVQEALERLGRGRTVVAIAHRLATVLRADEILVLHKGRIVERGTHAELRARGGRYARFVRMQDLSGSAPPAAPPVRVVLAPGRGRARVVLADGREETAPVAVARNGETFAQAPLVVLRPGAAGADVRLRDGEHADVAMFVEKDGREIQVCVTAIRGR